MIPSLITDPLKLSFEMLFGYARVSTDDQKLDLQHDALVHAGVERERIFEDRLSGMRADRPGLASVLKALRDGDTLVIWRLDRLGRSLKELISLADDLKRKGVQLGAWQSVGDDQAAAGTAISLLLAAMAGYQEVNRSRSVPLRVRVRVCRSR